MAKMLDIRVSAQTWDEDAVAKAWPRLVALAWPQWAARRGLENTVGNVTAGRSTGPGPVEKALGARRHGVLELAEALPDLLRFSGLSPEVIAALEGPVDEVEKIRRDLESALADWNPQKASTLAFSLEDALGKAEKSLAAF